MFGEGANFPALSVFAGAVCAMMLSRNSRYTDALIPFIAGSMFYYVIANECPVHNLVHTALRVLSAAGVPSIVVAGVGGFDAAPTAVKCSALGAFAAITLRFSIAFFGPPCGH